MNTIPYLTNRQGIYYFRRIVPIELRTIIGRREIIRSLATHDLKTARKAVIEMADNLDELFTKIQSGITLLTADDLSAFSKAFSKSKTEALMAEALVDFDDRKVENEEWEALHARTFKQEILDDLRYSRLSNVEPDVNALLSQYKVSLDRSSSLYKQLCRATLQGLADFYSNAEIIINGGFEDPRLVFDHEPEIREVTISELTFDVAIEKYLQDRRSGWSDKQHKSQSALLNYFLKYINEIDGKDASSRTLSSITSKIARDYKEHLQKTPSNKNKVYPTLTPKQSLGAAERDGAKLLSQETQNNYIQCLSTLYGFVTAELDYEGDNPFKGRSNTKAAKKMQRDQRNPFSKEQLTTIFSSPIYTGCKSLSNCHKKGLIIPIDSSKYWVPLIGLFTGMRLQEVLQLYLEDIYQHDNIWVFDLNTNHQDKSLKTPQSKRLVPIHSDLLALGFLDLLEGKISSKKSKRLFEDTKPASDGSYSSTFSKWFSRYLKNINVKTDKTSFHSFRHNIKDGFRDVGESDELAENFVGRSTGTNGESYGSGFSVSRLHEALHKIKFTEQIGVLKPII